MWCVCVCDGVYACVYSVCVVCVVVCVSVCVVCVCVRVCVCSVCFWLSDASGIRKP